MRVSIKRQRERARQSNYLKPLVQCTVNRKRPIEKQCINRRTRLKGTIAIACLLNAYTENKTMSFITEQKPCDISLSPYSTQTQKNRKLQSSGGCDKTVRGDPKLKSPPQINHVPDGE